MKTLKKDGINEKLLLETLAFIETHPEDWNQETWRCQTGMCFAGHAALTVGGARPMVTLSRSLIKAMQKPWSQRTDDEIAKIDKWNELVYYVRPERELDEQVETVIDSNTDKAYKGVALRERATTLLGPNAVGKQGVGWLFDGRKKLPGIRRHVMKVLEINDEELGRRLRRIAKHNNWEFPPRSKWVRPAKPQRAK